MDPVSQYLTENNYKISPAYFEGSKFQIGYQLCLPEITVIYKFENNNLLICDFSINHSSQDLKQSIFSFLKLMRQLRKEVTAINCIKGLIIDTVADSKLSQERIRLRDVLISQGAHIEKDELGDPWLVY